MCQRCGNSACTCNTPVYSYNWYNIDNQPCSTCSDTTVCKKKVPAKCSIYNGTLLTELNLDAGANVEEILAAINTILGNYANSDTSQTYKNNNILAALNDINDRLNALEGGTAHAPYTI
jgi:hypothetical protein